MINVSSTVGSRPLPTTSLYASTKAAVDNLTLSLAAELATRKLRVNAVAPGHTESEGTAAMGLFEGEAVERMAANTPLGRLGTPEDIAPAVVVLTSDESRWITGEIIRASGGLK